jgi:hypothetical protein
MILNKIILAKLFKTSTIEIDKYCGDKLKNPIQFDYLNFKEIETTRIKIIEKILSDKQIIASKERKNKWSTGWNEALSNFKKDNKQNSLIPKFYTQRENKIFRLGGNFIKVKKPTFEIKMLDIYRNWYFKKYFTNIENIYEFGAGTGHNLVAMSDIFKKKNLFGSDFVSPSVKILKLIAQKKKIRMKAFLFDMSKPNKKIKLLKNSAVYTSGALEQLSGNIKKFIDYTISQNPKIVVHVEPSIDFYNKNNLNDYLGKAFQSKRKYTSNLLTYLKKLERDKKIKIIKLLRSPFGSIMIEGYSLIVWKIKS